MSSLLLIFKLSKAYRWQLLIGIILSVATLISAIGLLSVSGWFISAAAVAGLSNGISSFNYMMPAGVIRAFSITRTVGRWSERVVSHNATFKILSDLRVHFFKNLAPLIPNRKLNFRDGDLLNRIVSDVDALDEVFLRLINPFVSGVIVISCIVIFINFFDQTIAALLGLIFPGFIFLMPAVFYFLGKSPGKQYLNAKIQFRINLLDWLSAHKELILFNALDKYKQQIDKVQDKLFDAQYKMAKVSALSVSISILFNGWLMVLILWLIADGVNQQPQSPVIALITFTLLASFEIMPPIIASFQHLNQTISSSNRLAELTNTEPEIRFPESSACNFNIDKAEISLCRLNFKYGTSQKLLLENIDLIIEHGEKIAVVGTTGCGKSTLLSLLARLYSPASGDIRINQEPISSLNEKDLRRLITFIPQRIDLLNTTLRRNLQLARPDAADEELMDVLKLVKLEYLAETEEGLSVILGGQNRILSGGECRRIGIARALLHKGTILLMDEPAEGLDEETEEEMINLLLGYCFNKTLIYVTHRTTGLEHMDKIYHLNDRTLTLKQSV
ncbi:MAG: cysteine/glutathione ABC transporter ATP-binding protein/permease CydC [Deltaproteobacteria bacterium]|nr:MAG: cysteine/glutathione ABC transporter ATP-binding protein/permease CydC [Deltaproteobacteria bacterium]